MKWFFMFMVLSISILSADFTRTGELVQDTLTNLEWQDENSTKDDLKSWQEAISYCEDLSLGGKIDWRLPNKNELITIIDYTKNDPAIDVVFQYTASRAYWTSTSLEGYYDYAWVVYFYNGYSYANFKIESDDLYVRCVRDLS